MTRTFCCEFTCIMIARTDCAMHLQIVRCIFRLCSMLSSQFTLSFHSYHVITYQRFLSRNDRPPPKLHMKWPQQTYTANIDIILTLDGDVSLCAAVASTTPVMMVVYLQSTTQTAPSIRYHMPRINMRWSFGAICAIKTRVPV